MNTSSPTPIKTDQEILENSMLEDDPNANSSLDSNVSSQKSPKWSPQDKDAQELANLYNPGMECLSPTLDNEEKRLEKSPVNLALRLPP